jgi:hypothetical protein
LVEPKLLDQRDKEPGEQATPPPATHHEARRTGKFFYQGGMRKELGRSLSRLFAGKVAIMKQARKKIESGARSTAESATNVSTASAARRMRTTIVIEHENQGDFEEALRLGVGCAREGYIGIKFGLKDRDEHGPKIEVRTAQCRKRRHE